MVKDDVERTSEADYESMIAMDDAYGSGVMNEEQSGKASTPRDKAQRAKEELKRRGVLVGDRVRVDARVGAPLPARAKHAVGESVASDDASRGKGERGKGQEKGEMKNKNAEGANASGPAPKRWMTRTTYGYVVCVRNGRAGVKRTGSGDTDESFPTYPTSWVTVLDVGEMWEMKTGPRNLAGASDDDMYEYQKATGQVRAEDVESVDRLRSG